MEPLPLNLYSEIVSHLLYNYDEPSWRDVVHLQDWEKELRPPPALDRAYDLSLLALSLTSRTLRQCVLPHLFRVVVLKVTSTNRRADPTAPMYQFCQLVQSGDESAVRLTKFVQRCGVVMVETTRPMEGSLEPLRYFVALVGSQSLHHFRYSCDTGLYPNMMEMLTVLPNIRALTFWGTSEVEEEFYNLDSDFTHPSLLSVSLLNHDGGPLCQALADAPALSSRLETFFIRLYNEEAVSGLEALIPCLAHLQELVILPFTGRSFTDPPEVPPDALHSIRVLACPLTWITQLGNGRPLEEFYIRRSCADVVQENLEEISDTLSGITGRGIRILQLPIEMLTAKESKDWSLYEEDSGFYQLGETLESIDVVWKQGYTMMDIHHIIKVAERFNWEHERHRYDTNEYQVEQVRPNLCTFRFLLGDIRLLFHLPYQFVQFVKRISVYAPRLNLVPMTRFTEWYKAEGEGSESQWKIRISPGVDVNELVEWIEKAKERGLYVDNDTTDENNLFGVIVQRAMDHARMYGDHYIR